MIRGCGPILYPFWPPDATPKQLSQEASVNSRVFLAESSMKSEEMSSSTPTSFLAMQVYAPVSSYRTLPMWSSLPLATERTVLGWPTLPDSPGPGRGHQCPSYVPRREGPR